MLAKIPINGNNFSFQGWEFLLVSLPVNFCRPTGNFEVNLTLITKKPLYKGNEASEVGIFNLTQTSFQPHLYLTQI